MLKKLIDDIYNDDDAPSAESHGQVMALLENADIENMDVEIRFLAYRYLQDIVRLNADINDHWNKDGTCVNEEFYPREMKQLQRICDATQYSLALYELAENRRTELVETFRQSSLPEAILSEHYKTETEIHELLSDVLQRQLSTYANQYFPVRMVALEPKSEMDNGFAGAIAPPPDEINDAADIPISIKNTLLNSKYLTFTLPLVFHEGVHHLTMQLGLALRDGNISPDNPLRKDAELSLARMKTRAIVSKCIHSAYINDGEENFAHRQQTAFKREMFGKPPPVRIHAQVKNITEHKPELLAA